MFRKLTDQFFASPQIGTDDIEDARKLGIRMIINNRPEGESDDQTPGPRIEEAARAAGMDYVAVVVPPEAREGDVLLELDASAIDGEVRYAVDFGATERRKQEIAELRASLPRADEGDLEL